MNIIYQTARDFETEALVRLYHSVGWESGDYPERLRRAIEHSDFVISAWDEERLVGLGNVLADGGGMICYVPYLLVDQQYQGLGIGKVMLDRICEQYRDYMRIDLISYADKIPFYERAGFRSDPSSVGMMRCQNGYGNRVKEE